MMGCILDVFMMLWDYKTKILWKGRGDSSVTKGTHKTPSSTWFSKPHWWPQNTARMTLVVTGTEGPEWAKLCIGHQHLNHLIKCCWNWPLSSLRALPRRIPKEKPSGERYFLWEGDSVRVRVVLCFTCCGQRCACQFHFPNCVWTHVGHLVSVWNLDGGLYCRFNLKVCSISLALLHVKFRGESRIYNNSYPELRGILLSFLL